MTEARQAAPGFVAVGVIVIGRNEGERLRRALDSVPAGVPVVYVDSGSTDGSVGLARTRGAQVHELDAAKPFSPARARREGVEQLVAIAPDVELIQFLDGDCELEHGWLDAAAAHLKAHEDVAIVCGRLVEREPDRSIYNRLSALQWNAPTGDIEAAGGIFMIRRGAYESVGGFNAKLVTREERELCTRVRAAGCRIVRIDAPMAQHDAGFNSFGQWWRRAVWGGYGDALGIHTRGRAIGRSDFHRIRRYLTWPVAVPAAAMAGAIWSIWFVWAALIPLAAVVANAMVVLSKFRYRVGCGDAVGDAAAYAMLHLVRKFATGYGFLLYWLAPWRRGRRPDPHRPERAVEDAPARESGRREPVAAARTP